MSLKVDVYSIMRNEIKILPYFLRHYETFADRIFVWDDGSNDGTLEMLKSHPKVKVLPLNLGRIDDDYFVNKLWPQYETISRGNADWVMCIDADEFIYHPNILNKLEELGKEGIKRVLCHGFTMYHPTFPTTSGQIYDEVKLGVKDKWSTKHVLFTPDIRIRWSRGRHRLRTDHPPNIVTILDIGIHILHFRYLGWEYYMERTKRNLAYDNVEFFMERVGPMPDGSATAPYAWFEKNKGSFVKVVE